jgi:small multidrug resistance family-3 protein
MPTTRNGFLGGGQDDVSTHRPLKMRLPMWCGAWPSLPLRRSFAAGAPDQTGTLSGNAVRGPINGMTFIRSLLLFVAAALAEIGGAWLVWQGVREHRGLIWIGAGVAALGLYGFVATLQPDSHFGRILAAYGGIFVAGSLAWGVVVDKFRPDRYDIAGSVVCLLGVALIMYAPRS